MPDTVMAADTVKFFVFNCPVRGYLPNKLLVTIQAVRIQYRGIRGLDANGLVKIHQCEGNRVMISVAGLGRPFADEIVRHVTVATDSKGVMAGFLPAVIFAAHDVAIDASLWIVRQIGCPAGVEKRIAACTQENSNYCTQQQFHIMKNS